MYSKYPVAIIGAGPIGLATAAHLSKHSIPFLVLEQGIEIGDGVRQWAHISMFTPWKDNIDEVAAGILAKYSWSTPEEDMIPTGAQLIDQYLRPLASTSEINPHLRLNASVVSVSRRGYHKTQQTQRGESPFEIRVESNGIEQEIFASAVIDASGTWKLPNPAGSNGLPASGERENSDHIFYGIPDIMGKHRQVYEGKDVLVVGGGHSATHALLELMDLNRGTQRTKVTWVLTKPRPEDIYDNIEDDELPDRGKLGVAVKKYVMADQIKVVTPFSIEQIEKVHDRLLVSDLSLATEHTLQADEMIVATGLRPDLTMFRELQIALDPVFECPIQMAPLIDPNIHDCRSVAPHSESFLRHPEEDFYILGMKSYGRAPTFLLSTGYEQVRSVAEVLALKWTSYIQKAQTDD